MHHPDEKKAPQTLSEALAMSDRIAAAVGGPPTPVVRSEHRREKSKNTHHVHQSGAHHSGTSKHQPKSEDDAPELIVQSEKAAIPSIFSGEEGVGTEAHTDASHADTNAEDLSTSRRRSQCW